MLADTATSVAALAALGLGFLLFVIAVLVTRWRRGTDEAERTAIRSRRSAAGIAIQVLAFFLACFGPQRIVVGPPSFEMLLQAAGVLSLWLVATGLFFAATHAMGRNWSVVARLRDDHQLVQSGPFAVIRHPIYTAIALQLFGSAIALGHPARLLVTLPLYALGTWLRVSEEERMMRSRFGAGYHGYAARVKRFVPGLF